MELEHFLVWGSDLKQLLVCPSPASVPLTLRTNLCHICLLLLWIPLRTTPLCRTKATHVTLFVWLATRARHSPCVLVSGLPGCQRVIQCPSTNEAGDQPTIIKPESGAIGSDERVPMYLSPGNCWDTLSAWRPWNGIAGPEPCPSLESPPCSRLRRTSGTQQLHLHFGFINILQY